MLNYLLFLMIGAQSGYTIGPNSLPRETHDIGATVAYSQALEFTRHLLGSSHVQPTLTLHHSKTSGREWIVNFDSKLQVTINARSARIQSYSNMERSELLLKGRPPVLELLVHTEAKAVERARVALQATGFADGLSIRKVILEPHRPGSWESATVLFERHVDGLKVSGAFAQVDLDRQDGVIVLLMQHLDFQLESQGAPMIPYLAAVKAQSVYAAHVVPSDRYTIDSAAPMLFYQSNMAGFGSEVRPDEWIARKVRKAYLVKFGPDSLWIDASTGQSMGGKLSPNRPQP